MVRKIALQCRVEILAFSFVVNMISHVDQAGNATQDLTERRTTKNLHSEAYFPFL